MMAVEIYAYTEIPGGRMALYFARIKALEITDV